LLQEKQLNLLLHVIFMTVYIRKIYNINVGEKHWMETDLFDQVSDKHKKTIPVRGL
jgi:hypothetical protein